MSTPTVARTCLDMGSTSKTVCSIWLATKRRFSGRWSPETLPGSKRDAKKEIPRRQRFIKASIQGIAELSLGRKYTPHKCRFCKLNNLLMGVQLSFLTGNGQTFNNPTPALAGNFWPGYSGRDTVPRVAPPK
jgi:hypothetical protein